MKNKKYFLFVTLIFISNIIFAKDKVFSITIEEFYGNRNGTILESVFELHNNEYKRLSQLDWEHFCNFYIGDRVTFSIFDFNLSLHAAGFIPKRSGVMKDSDWLDLTNVKNIYSISENYLLNSFFLGTKLSYDFKITNWFSLSPAVAFDYNNTYFEAKNGYGWYGAATYTSTGKNESWDSEYAKFFPTGKLYGITYNRMSLETWIGGTTSFAPTEKIKFNISAFINPVIYMESFDHHINKGYYADIAYNYFQAFKGNIEISYFIIKPFSINLATSIKYIKETQGLSFFSNDGKDYFQLSDVKSGSGETIFDITLSASYQF